MDYSPLDLASQNADVQRALSSAPAKMMAARGMAPLANPADLASVMYQICLDPDEKLHGAARKSAFELPITILSGAMADSGIDPQVIDYFVSRAQCRAELLQIVVLNPQTADETIADIAATADEKLADIIAENQIRILRYSDIIAALYMNKKARMSTVDKVVELAVRHEMKVPKLSSWDEISRAVLQSEKDGDLKENAAEMDAIFTKSQAPDTKEDEKEETDIRKWPISLKLRTAMVGTKFQRAVLIRDSKKMVSMAVIKSPAVKEAEAALYAGNNAICEDVIGYIANRGDWTKKYKMKTTLVANPKCPLPAAMRFLPHLRAKDITAIARSRNVPSALSSQAKKLKSARGGRR
ncbi:MAG: hypothetical protein JKY56_22380 [Kofleriaceae bacterium]|nr:hypothetical protein [Kofleriaceae bacterium]